MVDRRRKPINANFKRKLDTVNEMYPTKKFKSNHNKAVYSDMVRHIETSVGASKRLKKNNDRNNLKRLLETEEDQIGRLEKVASRTALKASVETAESRLKRFKQKAQESSEIRLKETEEERLNRLYKNA